jgi:hypothetical protein
MAVGFKKQRITGEEEFSGREQLEDCSRHEEGKTPNARNYWDNIIWNAPSYRAAAANCPVAFQPSMSRSVSQ